MKQIINVLLTYIQIQYHIICYLLTLLVSKDFMPKDEIPISKKYHHLQVDDLPIIEVLEKLDYQELIIAYEQEHGKPLKPVRRRNAKYKVPESMTCPRCGAPYIYLYDNTGGRGQYLCKICKTNFNDKNRFSKTVIFKCPHCSRTLEQIKERKNFYIYKCKNDDCSFYLKNLRSMSKEEKKHFKKYPHKFKVRYIYREFDFDFQPLSKESPDLPKVDISGIHSSPHTLGLILTYYVNYGLSSRNVAAIMEDVHNVNISHQTVINYADSVGYLVKPYLDNYPYELSDSFCSDETYIKVYGKWQYIFFFFDAVKKIILSYHVSPNRDTPSAIKAINDVLTKMDTIPDNLNFVVDGNPIYLLAKHYFYQQGINFDITQVIGLTNDDPVSKKNRPLKQIIERLNRTFKKSYRSRCGFKSSKGSVSYVNLFAAYFNFLRPHSALEKKVPVTVPQLINLPNMPARWGKLIELAQEHILYEQQHSA